MAFRVSSSDGDFNSRVNDIFSSLNEVEKSLPQDGLVFESSTSGLFKRDDEGLPTSRISTRNKRNIQDDEDAGFRTPNASNIPRRKKFKGRHGNRNAPDYEKNPENWTCYSMKETELLNDKQNKIAALSLLSELRQRKEDNQTEESSSSASDKVFFRKPSHMKNKCYVDGEIKNIDKSQGHSMAADFGGPEKFMMDEYVVGAKRNKKKKKSKKIEKKEGGGSTDKVALNYLQFEDDDDDEMEI